MLRAFLLLCLITRENFAFTVRGLFHSTSHATSTLRSVGHRKTGRVSISTIAVAHGNVTTNLSSRSFFRHDATTNSHHRKMKATKEVTPRRGTVKKGKHSIIRSFIPFTEGNFAEQLNHGNRVNAGTRNSLRKGNSKGLKEIKASTKTSTRIQTQKLNLANFHVKYSTMTPHLPVSSKAEFPRVYKTIEAVSKIDKIKGRDFADVLPLLKHMHSDASNQYTHLVARHAKDPDNPIFGDQPFFSFILNDYFDRSIDEEPMIYKDLHWGKEFDVALSPKRIRRLGGDFDEQKTEIDLSQAVNYDAKFAKENLQKRMNEWKTNEKSSYSDSKTFNNFVEIFAHRFGSSDEDTKRENILPNQNLNELQSSGEILDELAAIYDDRKVTKKYISMSSTSELKDDSNNNETSPTSPLSSDSLRFPKDLSRLRYLAKRDALFNNADYIDTSEFVI